MEGVVYRKLPKGQVSFKVTIASADIAQSESAALKHLGENLELKGFRKGKAPGEAVRRHAGEGRVFQEAGYIAIERKYVALLKEYKVHPIAQPHVSITKLAPGNPLECTITVAVYPEVELPDYRSLAQKLAKQRKTVSVEKDELARALEWLRQSRRKEAQVDRPATKGDLVHVDFETRLAGVKMEGGESRNHPLVLGDNKFVAGFDKEVEGMRAGETKQFSLAVPADHGNPQLRGKQAEFSVKVNAVAELVLPELDDAFARSLGAFADKAALETSVQDGLRQEKEAKEREEFRKHLAETIAGKARMEVADVLVDEELGAMMREMAQGLAEHGMELEAYLSAMQKTEEQFRAEMRPQAETRVRVALTLGAIAEKENIAATPQEINERVQEIANRESGAGKQLPDSALLSRWVSGIIRNEKVFAFLETL